MRFEWDDAKNATNQGKHAVSFEETRTVFFDDAAILYEDPDHGEGEERRFLLVGLSASLRLLVVVHCVRTVEEDVEVIRIISVRAATKRERRACSEERGKR